MRLIAFKSGDREGLAVRQGDKLLDLAALDPDLPADVSELLRRDVGKLERIRAYTTTAPEAQWRPVSSVTLLSPSRRPGKIICLGLNYIDHATETGSKRPDYPVVFFRAGTSLVAHGQPIQRPRCSEMLDYEAEMVVFIGIGGRHIPRGDALRHVAGYSLFNDGSIRDYQLRTPQWTVGKNFDATGGFGPDFVSADELPPGGKGLRIQARLNGAVVQDANTNDMIFDVAETIALLSEAMTLEPGDLIVSGTPAGVGMARKPPLWMKPGDVCEVEVEKIGILCNPIAMEG